MLEHFRQLLLERTFKYHITLFRRSMREDRRSNVPPLFQLKMRVTRALRHSVVSIEPLSAGQVKDPVIDPTILMRRG